MSDTDSSSPEIQPLRRSLRYRDSPKIEKNLQNNGEVFEVSDDSELENESGSSESFEKTSESSSDHSEQSSDNEIAPKPKISEIPKQLKMKQHYTIDTDQFFMQGSSSVATSKKTTITSNHTLDELETPRLPQDRIRELMNDMVLTEAHQNSLETLQGENCESFQKWLILLHNNFNILLHGFGSKIEILHKFHMECLKKFPVVVVNGFFPGLTVKDVLNTILREFSGKKNETTTVAGGNLQETTETIKENFVRNPSQHLYLIVHNLEKFTANSAQNLLANLACVENVHLIASVDHINSALIWDHEKLSKFNFTHWDVTSFAPYVHETSYETSMMVQNTGTLALSSLRNVFASLTSNAKGIYRKVAEYQLENIKNQYYQGLLFKDLYQMCRETFLVSSDLALRSQLTEFIDHKLVKIKRNVDGSECLLIQISNNVLQQFLNEFK